LRLSSNVVDAISNGFTEFLVDEVVHIDFIRVTFRPIIAASVLVVVDQPFFLVSTEITGWPSANVAVNA
jgi:hypothetical protein